MSVLMTLRVHANPKSLENEDPSLMLSIRDKAMTHGITYHRFFVTEDEVMVVDEWPDEASFHRFFEEAPEIAGVIERAGGGAPEITIWKPLDIGDNVG